MDNLLFHGNDCEEMELPPGFRFHPTDEELITHYLSPKSLQSSFCAKVIGEVDLNKVEPWDLPWRAKMGEREFYFFCMIDRKYPTGLRTNRATDAGFWKATGKDKEIYCGKNLIGMKKTLVFYRGRAPKGEKTNWVMHEYRLEGEYNSPTSPVKNEWVISRIFQKTSGGKKIHILNLERTRNYENVSHQSNSSPLMEYSGCYDHRRPTNVDHMNFFSDPTDEMKFMEEIVDSSNNSNLFTKSSVSGLIVPTQFTPRNEMVQDQSMKRYFVRNDRNLKVEFSTKREMKTHIGLVSSGRKMAEGSDDLSCSREQVDLDCLWNY